MFAYRHHGAKVIGPLQTRDGRLFASDEILTPMTSGQTISRGTVWTGTGENPQLDKALAPVRDFTRGFIPGNIVDAEDPGVVISLARVFAPHVPDETARHLVGLAIDDAEEQWRKDKRSGAANDQGVEGTEPSDLVAKTFGPSGSNDKRNRDDACDLPPERTGDSRMPHRPTSSVLFNAARTASFAKNLQAARAAQLTVDVTNACTAGAKDDAASSRQAPTRPRMFDPSPSRDYAESLKAGRKARG